MYLVAVPDTNENVSRCTPEKVLEQVVRFDAGRVFLALGQYEPDAEKRRLVLAELEKNCRFFQAQGYEVGAWIWAFMLKDSPYTPMKSLNGQVFKENMCPTDEAFLEYAAAYAADIARTGVDILMYDDDLRYGFLGDAPACVCENHLRRMSQLLGEEVTPELIREKVCSGGPNKYREAYRRVNGEALRHFAKRMREAVDAVSPSVRVGACSCMTSWDIDGVSAGELAHLLAGNTKPFVRLIGAPYWAAAGGWGNSLQDVIELSRMESAWTADGEIEIFAEGDAYPRPRTNCPASFVEGFDTAMRAAGCTDGILKYGIDYYSNIDYEQGYAQRHERNRGLYAEIETYFGGKTPVGVRVYEYPEKLEAAVFKEEANVEDLFFSYAARMLSYNSIPTVWQGTGLTGAAFGENARHIPPDVLQYGLITDIHGAQILTERGVDVGLASVRDRCTADGSEVFPDNQNRLRALWAEIYDVTLRDNAEVLSYTEQADKTLPVSYRYENAAGQRFLVQNIVYKRENPSLYRHYERNRQLRENIPWLSGKTLPVDIGGHPALYVQMKEDETALAVGFWNFHPDVIFEPAFPVHGEYTDAAFINCRGTFVNGKIRLQDIPAYGFAGVCLRKM